MVFYCLKIKKNIINQISNGLKFTSNSCSYSEQEHIKITGTLFGLDPKMSCLFVKVRDYGKKKVCNVYDVKK